MRDIADQVGITERTAHRIVNELVAAGYLSKHRVGRCNSYQVHPEVPLRHPLERDHAVGELLELLLGGVLDD
jgi:DNA-binding Lrp family transcriptional regulator